MLTKYNECEVQLWDLGGKESLRKLWESYYDEVEGVIFMIDISGNIEDSIAILSNLLNNIDRVLDNKYIQNLEIPILILLNKIDLVTNYESVQKVYDNLEYKKIYNKNFTVIEISALKG
jgi:small GTP-binding protein